MRRDEQWDFGEVHFAPSKLEVWRDKKVSIPIEELQDKWDEDAEILYIGSSASKFVQKRVQNEHIPFWNGVKSTSAYGGHAIGQIQNFENLEVWYFRCDKPLQMKKELLKEFKKQYGERPFANWKD